MADLSLNVRGFKVSTAQVRAALDKLHGRHALIADNVGMANELAADGYTVVYRDFWPDPQRGDDDIHLHRTPAEYDAHMAGLGLHEAVYWYAGNEPTQQYQRLTDWTLDAMRLASTRGRRLVVCNFSVGTPEPEDWDTALAPFLPALADVQHVLGLHEYLVIDYETSLPYYVGRFKNADKAARALGLTPPRKWITEGAAYDLAGSWQSMGLSAERLAADVGRAKREVYDPNGVEVIHAYSFGLWANGQGWQFDIMPALDALAGIVGEGDPMVWADCELTVKADPTLNVRAEPNTTAAVVTFLTPGVYGGQCAGEQIGGDYNWLHWRSNKEGGPEGWLALRNLKTGTVLATVREVTPEPPPVEPPPVEPPMPTALGPILKSLQQMLRVGVSMCQQLDDMIQQTLDEGAPIAESLAFYLHLQAYINAEIERLTETTLMTEASPLDEAA